MFNLEKIQERIKTSFDLNNKNGLVISWFKDKNLIFENWIIFTEESIDDNLKKLYEKFIKDNKKINILVIDMIKNINEISSVEELQKIDLLNEWIFIWDEKSDAGSFILPNTNWIKNIKQVIDIIKQKVEFSSKNVNIYKFTTKRFVITK